MTRGDFQTAFLRRCEDVRRQFAGWAGQDRFRLSAELGQRGGGLVGELLLELPAHGAIERVTGLDRVAQAVMGHRQEEQVKGIGLALAGGDALLQGRDRIGMPARTVLGDAQRVEVDRRAGRERGGFPGQDERALGIAQPGWAGEQPPGQIVVLLSAGESRFCSLGQVGQRLLRMAQAIVNRATQLVELKILRISPDQGVEVRKGVLELAEAAGGLRARNARNRAPPGRCRALW